MTENLPRAIHTAELTLGGCRLRCHVLDNGMRVFDAGDVEAFFQALAGDAPLHPKEVENLARFVTRGELPKVSES